MKIICIGRNYLAHIKELDNALPTEPMFFMKPETALLPEGEAFPYPDFSKEIHYETELVLRICKSGRNIADQDAPFIMMPSPWASTSPPATSKANARPKGIHGKSPRLSTIPHLSANSRKSAN